LAAVLGNEYYLEVKQKARILEVVASQGSPALTTPFRTRLSPHVVKVMVPLMLARSTESVFQDIYLMEMFSVVFGAEC